MPMNPDVKAAWVAKLRSGTVEQGRDQLRDGDRFCCLGVLCDLHAKETGEKWRNNLYWGASSVLPHAVVEWAELEDDSPSVRAGELTDLNDTGFQSFAEIADQIEAEL